MLDIDQLKAQVPMCLAKTDFDGLGEKIEGKVRDSYLQDGRRVIVTTDRLSAFDRIITTIPFKGQVLNQMAQFWFENTNDIVANHVVSFPDPNVTIGRECEVFPVEFVVRGYITGSTSTSAWTHYKNGERNFCGNELPDGMVKNQKLEKAILTPSTKAEKGGHDESVSREQVLERGLMSEEDFDAVGEMAMKLYRRGVEVAAKQGIILVDTKYEFGKDESGQIVLVDEIHTPDSSRFWYMDEYDQRLSEGREQKKIDKEYVRLWLSEEAGFVGDGEVPVVPDEVRIEAARRYIEAYELITGQEFKAEVDDPVERIKQNLGV